MASELKTNLIPLDLAAKLEFEGAAIPQAAAQIQNLYKLFAGVDATQVEVSRHSSAMKP